MTVYPNCKINLGLNIVERRADCYHNIETVFYPIPRRDELSITPANEDCFEADGIPIAGNPMDNLVVKVVRMLRNSGFDIPPLHIRLWKHIPSGAGLGGGSSDASHTLRLLNTMFSLDLTTGRMKEMVKTLGADCPFFIDNTPAFAEGIGDVITPIELNLAGWHLTLVKPNDFVSTKEAYALVKPTPTNTKVNEIVKHPVEEWKEALVNDFEESVFPRHPAIQEIKERLYQKGAAYASMSGSGSSVFSLSRAHISIDNEFEDCFRFQCVL